MIDVQDKKICCGCTACLQRCPKHCISLKEDQEGFLYPFVNKELCINCGICEKVCPFINPENPIPAISVCAAKNKDKLIRIKSSSGGVFLPLAKLIISKQGVVFGATFDSSFDKVLIVHGETEEEVLPMMGSKYLQAEVGSSYKEVENYLKGGRIVLFTGSPCQVAGLNKFLCKNYSNLLTVEYLCHGVPSPGVWRKYKQEMLQNISAQRAAAGKNTVLSSSLNVIPAIAGIEFRNKSLHGWKKYSFVVREKSTFKVDKNSVLLSCYHYKNPYMRGFLNNLYLRPSCYNCKSKNGVSHADLTIGDFWGVNTVIPKFDDDKGVSLVLVNSKKGKSYFKDLDMDVRYTELNVVHRMNGGFKERIPIPRYRDVFFTSYQDGDKFVPTIENMLYVPISKRVGNYLNSWPKRFLKFVLPVSIINKLRRSSI